MVCLVKREWVTGIRDVNSCVILFSFFQTIFLFSSFKLCNFFLFCSGTSSSKNLSSLSFTTLSIHHFLPLQFLRNFWWEKEEKGKKEGERKRKKRKKKRECVNERKWEVLFPLFFQSINEWVACVTVREREERRRKTAREEERKM